MRKLACLLVLSLLTPALAQTEITFWHAMSGSREQTVNALAQKFNQENPAYRIVPEFTGSYAETLTKAIAGYRAGNPPNIVQVYEVGTQTMLDSNAIVPVYTLNDGDVDFGEFVQPILKYYSYQDNLYCMPFNSSTAMLYYNKDAFEQAGLDPNRPPRTFEEVHDMSRTIIDSGAAKGGISFGWPAWILEQTFAYDDQELANNDNGRSGLATEVFLNSDFGKAVLKEWQRWAQDGVLVYGGREYSANDPFLAGEFAMLVQSTSSLGGILKKADFKVGTAFLPRLSGYPRGNSVIGGGCLWVMQGASDEQLAGTWEFLKFLSRLDNTITWHKETGYFPTTNEAVMQLLNEGWFAEEPNHLTAFMQILTGNDSPAARGVLLGNFVQIRDIEGVAIEQIVTQGRDVAEALDDATQQVNQVLRDYKELVGR